MVTDAQGLRLTSSAEAAALLDRAIGHLVRFQAEVVDAAAAAAVVDPGCSMAGVLSAYLALMSTEASGVAKARSALSRVEPSSWFPRERAHWVAVECWAAGDMVAAGALLGDLSIEYPRDILALAVGHQIDFFSGNTANLRDRIGRALEAWSPHDRLFGFVQGMYAFGLEECNLYGLSEACAQRALEANPEDVWALHAMVHTCEMQGRIVQGIRFMRDREAEWTTGNFLKVHNSWHYALYLLQGGDVPGALDVYDGVLHHDESEDIALELLDATALLWRLHLEAIPVGDRWKPLADAWGRIIAPGYYPFNDMHAVMAYVGAGDLARARDLVAELEVVAEQTDQATTGWQMTRDVGLPVCRSLVRFAQGDYRPVIDNLQPIRTRLHEFGGSHAQRDVMERTLLEAALRLPQPDLAKALLSERLGVRDSSTYAWSKLAGLLASTGEQPRATSAAERAASLTTEIVAAG